MDSRRIYLPSVPKGINASHLRAGLHLAMVEGERGGWLPQPRAERGEARAERAAGETVARTFTISAAESDWLRSNVQSKGGSVARSLVTWAVTVREASVFRLLEAKGGVS